MYIIIFVFLVQLITIIVIISDLSTAKKEIIVWKRSIGKVSEKDTTLKQENEELLDLED